MRGTEFHRADWLDLMDNEEEGGALVAIFALFYEHDPDPGMRPYKEPVSRPLKNYLRCRCGVKNRLKMLIY